MIEDIITGHIYSSHSGVPFIVIAKAAHGQDCSLSMLVYQNLEPTKDYPAGKIWVEPESLFMQQFKTFESGVYYDYNHNLSSTGEGVRSGPLSYLLGYGHTADGSVV